MLFIFSVKWNDFPKSQSGCCLHRRNALLKCLTANRIADASVGSSQLSFSLALALFFGLDV